MLYVSSVKTRLKKEGKEILACSNEKNVEIIINRCTGAPFVLDKKKKNTILTYRLT